MGVDLVCELLGDGGDGAGVEHVADGGVICIFILVVGGGKERGRGEDGGVVVDCVVEFCGELG